MNKGEMKEDWKGKKAQKEGKENQEETKERRKHKKERQDGRINDRTIRGKN